MKDTLQALAPALIAGIPVLILAFHLRQQNRLERKKVEVEYLRKSLEVLELPVQTLMRVNSRLNVLAHHHQQGTITDFDAQIVSIGSEWETAIDKHMSTLLVAKSFALRGGDSKLADALDAAMDTANDLRFVVVNALERTHSCVQEAETPKPLHQDERVLKSLDGRAAAARQLVARIHALYG